jgi:murein DD-endopeptidase MepM/ murein hydrolase activator NlpD
VPDPRRLSLLTAIVAAACLVGVSSALGQSAWEKKQYVDSRISGLQAQIAQAKQREGVLSSEIDSASSRIDGLAGRIGELNASLAVLERDLAAHRDRLARLRSQFEEQTRHLQRLRQQHQVAQRRLGDRLVQLYETSETTELDVLFQAESLVDLIEQLDYFNEIGSQDKEIAETLARLKVQMRVARQKTARLKAEVAEATALLARKTEEQRAAQAALVAQQNALAAARDSKESMLASVAEHRHEAEEDLEAMQAASASLGAQIRSSQGSSPAPSGGGGLVWPVNGVLTSGFGWRWGRMHEGIDISAPCGTPVRASAAGNVIFSGWMGGYGNLIVLDHGGGLATAYAHLSASYAGGGVSQGQTIGAVGTTGSSTGCHLHFEVRVNGSPVDPMGYL